MAKNVKYYTEKSIKINNNIKDILKELPAVCTDYIRYITPNTSPLTRLAYVYDMKLFFSYLKTEVYTFADVDIHLISAKDINKITLKDIEGYQDYIQQYIKLNDKGSIIIQNSTTGIVRKISSLRAFYKYLYTRQYIDGNITELLQIPQIREKPILYLENDEVENLINVIKTGNGLNDRQTTFHKITMIRGLAIVILMLGTGIRASELIGLNLDDFDYDNNAFVIQRKGGDQVILYYSDTVKGVLEEYLNYRKGMNAVKGHEYAYFLSIQNKRYSYRALQNLVKKYTNIGVPLKKNLSPHKLRATFGTNLYRKTGDIYLVANALGHSDVNTTKKHYASISEDMRKKAALEVELPI